MPRKKKSKKSTWLDKDRRKCNTSLRRKMTPACKRKRTGPKQQ